MNANIEPGQVIAGFRVDALLGRGGMAEVYKVWHTTLHRFEAMKVLPPQLALDTSFVDRFLTEARTAARLRHPNIVPIHTVSGPDSTQPYFTMQLVEGGDLCDLIEAQNRLGADEALPILSQAAAALDYAHDQGIVHRDVKPGNILLEKNGRAYTVMVVDFGIARAQEASESARLTKTGMIVGTPEYMSPEQAGAGAAVDRRADQYSLAVVAYEMLSGTPPFGRTAGSSAITVIMSHVQDAVKPIQGLPKATNDALLKGLSKSPEDRFTSCSAFVASLESASRPAPRKAVIPGRGKESKWLLFGLVGVFLAAGVIFVAFGIRQVQGPSEPPTKGHRFGVRPVADSPIVNELESLERQVKENPEAAVEDAQFLTRNAAALSRFEDGGKTLTLASDAELQASGHYFLALRSELRAASFLTTLKPNSVIVSEVAAMRDSCSRAAQLTKSRTKLSAIRNFLISGDAILKGIDQPASAGERGKIADLIRTIDTRRKTFVDDTKGNPTNAH